MEVRHSLNPIFGSLSLSNPGRRIRVDYLGCYPTMDKRTTFPGFVTDPEAKEESGQGGFWGRIKWVLAYPLG
jgi:hypothetical protein